MNTPANTWRGFLKNTRLDRHVNEIDPALRPLWTIDIEDEDEILTWHKRVQDGTETLKNRRASDYQRRLDVYSGLHLNAKGRVGRIGQPTEEWGNPRFKVPEVVINHSYELTEQWVAKLSRFSP